MTVSSFTDLPLAAPVRTARPKACFCGQAAGMSQRWTLPLRSELRLNESALGREGRLIPTAAELTRTVLSAVTWRPWPHMGSGRPGW
jgi:hypothetical protein